MFILIEWLGVESEWKQKVKVEETQKRSVQEKQVLWSSFNDVAFSFISSTLNQLFHKTL